MIEFFTPELTDRALVDSYFLPSGYRCCEYAFTNIFAWRDAFQEEIATCAGYLTVRCAGPRYFWPAGKGDIRPMLQALELDAKAQGKPLSFYALTEAEKERLEQLYPGKFTFTLARDGFDYCYDIHRLADLTGKKLHAKRNHIHRLDEACPGWDWTPMTQADIAPCLAMDAAWHQEALTREAAEGGLSTLDDEHRALVLALENREALGLDGIVLRWQEEILGFTLGALLTENVFDVHFERARGDIQGAYPAVNRSFARYIREKYPQVRYLDREDDMGLPGLRKAKESYYPDYLEVNFSAVEIRCDLTSRPKTEG